MKTIRQWLWEVSGAMECITDLRRELEKKQKEVDALAVHYCDISNELAQERGKRMSLETMVDEMKNTIADQKHRLFIANGRLGAEVSKHNKAFKKSKKYLTL